MITNQQNEQEKNAVCLEYNTPTLEEYGDLHELTHGDVGNTTDNGGGYILGT